MITGHSVQIATLDADGRWTSAGTTIGPLTFSPLLDEADHYRVTNQLYPVQQTLSVAFWPSKKMLRILLGPRWSYDRHHHRVVTRRKYRNRKGRR